MRNISLKELMMHAEKTGADINQVLDMWNTDRAKLISHYHSTKNILPELNKHVSANDFMNKMDGMISADVSALRRILDTIEHTVSKEVIGGNLMVMVRVTTILDDKLGEEEHMVFDGAVNKTDEGVVNAIEGCISELSYRLLCSM